MQLNRNPTNGRANQYGAERCYLLQSAVAFLIALPGFATGCNRLHPDPSKHRIASSSMAPTWFGPHRLATCPRCGQQSAIVEEAYDPLLPTRCFSCGSVCTCSAEVYPGENIEIASYHPNVPLKRLDLLTFQQTDGNDNFPQTLKRIWALPGEHIELRQGEAWLDGKLLQKSAREFSRVCIPISLFPKDTRSHWWIVKNSERDATPVEETDHSPLLLDKSQQLEFRYARPNRIPAIQEMRSSKILDDYAFNQNSIAQFHEVPDFLVLIELAEPANAPWTIVMESQGKRYGVEVAVKGTVNSKAVFGPSIRLLIAVCDGRLLAASDLQESIWNLSEVEIEKRSEGPDENSPITIMTSDRLRISRLMVARDQWLGPRESRLNEWTPEGTEAEVKAEELSGYFVLGDNLQLSIDSRDRSVGRIATDQVTGKVMTNEDSTKWILARLNHAFRGP